MNTQVIKTENEYEDALQRTYDLLQITLAADSPEFLELERLSKLIEAYELIHYPINK